MLLRTTRRRGALATLLASSLIALTACSGASPDPGEASEAQADAAPASQAAHDAEASAEPSSEPESAHAHAAHGKAPVKPKPLRAGETRRTIEMPESYTPSAPYGKGTDDYRCFLLDPELDEPAWLTGTHVRPGNPNVVHHVILFQVPPTQVAQAEAKDAEDDQPGWTCFGGSGLEQVQNVDDAAWIGAWAPGGQESVTKPGYGVRLEKGTRVVMQVHYNLLAGDEADTSATQLRLAPGARPYQALRTMLMPAPVELPCRAEHSDGPLCEREAALADVKERFGEEARTADLLHLLCGTSPRAGERQSCTRTIGQPMTIHGVAGHMHLLGRTLKIESNPGTPQAKVLLDIPLWNFDDQGARPIDPVHLEPFEKVRVTCRHVQWLRDELPAFEGQPDRYVVWGEGTTDEMCLGMLQITRP